MFVCQMFQYYDHWIFKTMLSIVITRYRNIYSYLQENAILSLYQKGIALCDLQLTNKH